MKTRIKEFRVKHNLTQEKLAQKVGVRRETIVFLEKEKYNPSLNLAHDIAEALKTTIDKLFFWEEKKEREIEKDKEKKESEEEVGKEIHHKRGWWDGGF